MDMDRGLTVSQIDADDGVRGDTASIPANGPSPLPMDEVYIAMMTASSLATAGRIGLFEALADGPLDAQTLAGAIGADVEGAARLSDFLVATGHLKRMGDLVANAPHMMRWFTRHADVNYGPGLAWTADAWTIMADLPGAVRRGGPERLLWDRMTEKPELGTNFSRYMNAFADHLAPDLLAIDCLPSRPRRLLDLGGSHGAHSMAFCQRYPDLEAVIVDLESALTQTRVRIDDEGFSNRISVRPGDVRACDWGDGYDIALYLSVAHNMSIEENRKIFRHLAQVMRPGGVLVIHDYPRETTPAIFEAAFRLTLLVETGTRTLSYFEITDMLDEAGFSSYRNIILSPAEKGTLIIARR